MSDSRNASTELSAGDQLNAYHAQIVGCRKPDNRYVGALSNQQKVEAVCMLLRIKPEEFDLSASAPFNEWLRSNDVGLLRCGLYISDLRRQFLDLLINDNEKGAAHDVWEAHASAQWYMEQFDNVMFRRQTGEVRPDRRVYQ